MGVGTIKRRHVAVGRFRDTLLGMSDKDTAPHEPTDAVKDKQVDGYTEADFRKALDRATRRRAPSEPGPESPRRSARRGRGG